MHDREEVIKEWETVLSRDPLDISWDLIDDTLALLKEQEEREQKWMQTIADSQLANAPKDSPMSLDEQLECEYKSGIYDGLQMAFEILMEGR